MALCFPKQELRDTLFAPCLQKRDPPCTGFTNRHNVHVERNFNCASVLARLAKQPVFVANPVTEFKNKELINVDQWHHVRSAHRPVKAGTHRLSETADRTGLFKNTSIPLRTPQKMGQKLVHQRQALICLNYWNRRKPVHYNYYSSTRIFYKFQLAEV